MNYKVDRDNLALEIEEHKASLIKTIGEKMFGQLGVIHVTKEQYAAKREQIRLSVEYLQNELQSEEKKHDDLLKLDDV